VSVHALDPADTACVPARSRYSPPPALGSLDKLPPDRLLTALGLAEPDRDPKPPPTPAALAPDVLALLRQGGPYWAGNLNLFFPGKDVERHVAQALRVYPGCVNLALFIIGETNDAYRYELTGDAGTWKARLFDTF